MSQDSDVHSSSSHPFANQPAIDLCDFSFHNKFISELPADPIQNNKPRQVSQACFSHVEPTPVPEPRLLAWSESLAHQLGILRPLVVHHPTLDVLCGNLVMPGMRPYAARYGGHQFGHWAGQLGDGRAITLTEIMDRFSQRQELQLKGAGPTPYSRTADGRAVLRSSVREFMCSEAMHYLGIPTTRALSLVDTGAMVVRDMFYDGNPIPEQGAVVCRVAPSFIRFGNFQILAANGEHDLLKRLADYVIINYFPECMDQGLPSYEQWFHEVCRRTAVLVKEWMRVGFVHGVMNTDNMSILGLTIDYGPYGWLEGYEPQWTPNTTDSAGRRYCYGSQPQIAHWNLLQLANTLYPLFVNKTPLENGLALFVKTYEQEWSKTLADKLGFLEITADDESLLIDLFQLLEAEETDFTIFFRKLATLPVDHQSLLNDDRELLKFVQSAFYIDAALTGQHADRVVLWLRRYIARIGKEKRSTIERVAIMNRANPKYVFRNYLAQLAIDALALGDDSVLSDTMHVLQRPYDEQPEFERYAERRPEWARHRAGCSALSCSS